MNKDSSSDSTIRLRLPWRGRIPGSIIPGLAYGVAEVLVSRRLADWAPGQAAHGFPLGQVPPSTTGTPPASPSVPPSAQPTTDQHTPPPPAPVPVPTPPVTTQQRQPQSSRSKGRR